MLLRESQGENLALTVLYVPHSLDSGRVQGFGFSGRVRALSGRLKFTVRRHKFNAYSLSRVQGLGVT